MRGEKPSKIYSLSFPHSLHTERVQLPILHAEQFGETKRNMKNVCQQAEHAQHF